MWTFLRFLVDKKSVFVKIRSLEDYVFIGNLSSLVVITTPVPDGATNPHITFAAELIRLSCSVNIPDSVSFSGCCSKDSFAIGPTFLEIPYRLIEVGKPEQVIQSTS